MYWRALGLLAVFVLSVADGASPASCSTAADCQATIPFPSLATTVNCVNQVCSVTYSGSCSNLSPLANYSNKDGTPVTVTLAGATVQLQNIITPRDALENTGDGYHGFYCPDCFTGSGCPATGTNWWTVPGTASFKEFADGTAILNYTVFHTNNPLYQIQIDVALSGGATFSQLPGTFANDQAKINFYIKNERGVANQDLKKYHFYQNVAAHITGPASSQAFTVAKPIGPAGNFVSAGGQNPLSGLVVDMDVFMFPFETGLGASNKDSPSDGLIDGMSGWIARSNAVVHQPTSGPCTFSQPYNNHADFNLYTTRTCTAQWQTGPDPNGGGTPENECPEDCVVFTRSPTAPQPIVVSTEVETCVTLSFSTN